MRVELQYVQHLEQFEAEYAEVQSLWFDDTIYHPQSHSIISG